MRKAPFSSKSNSPRRPFLPHPSIHAWRAQRSADQGSRLFEGAQRASLRETPLSASTTGCLERSGRTGIAGRTSLPTFLLRNKKVGRPPGRIPGQQRQPKSHCKQGAQSTPHRTLTANNLQKSSSYRPPSKDMHLVFNSKPYSAAAPTAPTPAPHSPNTKKQITI